MTINQTDELKAPLAIILYNVVVMGPGQKFLTQVGSIFSGSGWVTIYGLGLDLENFH